LGRMRIRGRFLVDMLSKDVGRVFFAFGLQRGISGIRTI